MKRSRRAPAHALPLSPPFAAGASPRRSRSSRRAERKRCAGKTRFICAGPRRLSAAESSSFKIEFVTAFASQKPRLKPPALRPGDKIGIVAPASNIKRELLEAGCAGLRAAGYEPVYSESIFDRDLYFAGSVERRARELEEMFVRDDIRAIVCARGGYGANYLLHANRSRKDRRASQNLRRLQRPDLAAHVVRGRM